MDLVFRVDDVSQNTDLWTYESMINVLRVGFNNCRIISCVSLIGKTAKIDEGNSEVYAGEFPFKDKENKWFYDINYLWAFPEIKGEIASHGMFHFDHTRVSKDLQEMSILSSCNYLGCKMFLPPFNRYNKDTVDICNSNGITLIGKEGWKSLDHEEFDPDHKFWYFHPWRYTLESFAEKFSGHSVNVG